MEATGAVLLSAKNVEVHLINDKEKDTTCEETEYYELIYGPE